MAASSSAVRDGMHGDVGGRQRRGDYVQAGGATARRTACVRRWGGEAEREEEDG